jgi:hypothetical protein
MIDIEWFITLGSRGRRSLLIYILIKIRCCSGRILKYCFTIVLSLNR